MEFALSVLNISPVESFNLKKVKNIQLPKRKPTRTDFIVIHLDSTTDADSLEYAYSFMISRYSFYTKIFSSSSFATILNDCSIFFDAW